MRLENAFTVPAPVDQAWSVLLDVERVAPCLPGAALEGGDGTTYSGTMTIKLGPVKSRYHGTVEIAEADVDARRAVLRASARDARAGTAAATITTELTPEGDGTRVQVATDLQLGGPAAQFGRGVMQDVSGRLMQAFAECLAEELGVASGAAVTGGAAAATSAAAASSAIAYEDTRVGRLPLGPAGDAALAAAEPGAAGRAGADGVAIVGGGEAASAGGSEAGGASRARRSAEVLDLGAASRAAVLKRVAPVAALGVAAAAAAVVLRRRR